MAKVYEANRSFKNLKYGGGGSYDVKSEPIIKKIPSSTGVPIVRRALTIEERKERTAKGLYFNCDEQYSPGSQVQREVVSP